MISEKAISPTWISDTLSSRNHPVHNLGRLAVFSFFVAFISGLYIFIFYRIDPLEAYNSTETISKQGLGGIMRSFHRYSSDLLILTSVLHFIHTLALSKFRLTWSWLTGLFTLGLTIIIGLTGFVLVWDQKAKLIGLLSAKFITAFPLVNPSLSGIFIMNALKELSGFFRISFVAHFFMSLIFLLVLYIHISRIGNRKWFPSPFMMIMSLLVLLVFSLGWPVQSDLRADATVLPIKATFDWYFFAGFYIMKFITMPVMWLITLLFIAFFGILPLYKKQHSVNKTGQGNKVIRGVMLLLFTIVTIAMPVISRSNIQFFNANTAVAILNFKYVSSATETEEYSTDIKHMKFKSPIINRRADIKIELKDEQGNIMWSKIYQPSGLRKNSAIQVYNEIPVSKPFKVYITEVQFPEKQIVSEIVTLKDAAVIGLNENRFFMSDVGNLNP